MRPLSVTIICLNEDKRIRDCLNSASFADQIIVVDSGSTDRTVEIAREFTDKIFHQEWLGNVGQKNFALDKAENDWVLSLDADEVVTPQLAREIQSVLSSENLEQSGFLIQRRNFFLGRWIEHSSWSPDLKLRLFDRTRGRFSGEDPHDFVKVNGKVGRLEGHLFHYTYENFEYQARALTRWGMDAARAKHRAGKKFRLSHLILRPPYAFFKGYILKQGFRDGMPGLIIAVMNSYYTWLKYARLWEIERFEDSDLRKGQGDLR
jgi:glycosyltransferase involved in cell wall biosynthesis